MGAPQSTAGVVLPADPYAASAVQPAADPCKPPYYFDAQGIKKYKQDCVNE